MKYVKVFIVLCISALFVSPFIVVPRVLKVNVITCQSQFGPCNRNLEVRIKRVEDRKASLYETKRELQKILSNDILVSDFSLQFKLPGRLAINLLERKPKYALKIRGTNSYALVGKEGYVIYFQDATNLPVLIVSEPPPNVGEVVSEEKLFALDLLYDMFSLYQVRTGAIENGSLVIELEQGPKVIFPLEGDREALLGSLRLILSKLNSDEQDSRIENVSGVSIIDLRFKNPVVK